MQTSTNKSFPHPIPPFVNAQIQIDEKHSQLGGDNGLLGVPVEDMKECPDSIGFFRRFKNGMIYWTPATGAHEIHGAILEKWSTLGFERSFLGYPVGDETGTPDGIGRFNQFQGGMIYWTPTTGAHEVHGAILEKWSALGFERSFLGYPVTDETDFSEDGRLSVFERGAIYWWPDTGAIELNDVVVHYTGLVCFGETDNDQLSNSDEPYVVMGLTTPTGTSTIHSQTYEDVDGGESCPDLMEIYRGKPSGLTISVLLMEHDEGDPDTYKAEMQAAIAGAAAGLTTLIRLIPKYGPFIAETVGPLLAAVAPKVGEVLSDLLDLGDDQIGNTTVAITAKQMVILAARTGNSEERGIGFKVSSPLISGLGASYKVYFGLIPA